MVKMTSGLLFQSSDVRFRVYLFRNSDLAFTAAQRTTAQANSAPSFRIPDGRFLLIFAVTAFGVDSLLPLYLNQLSFCVWMSRKWHVQIC